MKNTTLFLLLLLTAATSWAQCWKTISFGELHNIGIKTDGTLWGWGLNSGGTLGNGSSEDASVLVPMQSSTATDWKEISAGQGHTVALKNNGTLWAWGNNTNGELGDGTTTQKTVPTQIGIAIWKMVVAGRTHNLGIKTDGTLWAWGDNQLATIGDGTVEDKLVPTLISSATDWKMVSGNNGRSFALKNNGTLWAWGFNSTSLGIGFDYAGVTYVTSPVQVGTDTDWKMMAVGSGYTLALKTNNALWAWGGGDFGNLGNGTTASEFFPVQIGTATDWETVAADSVTSFGIKTDGTLWGWGQNTFGQLGNNNTVNLLSPTSITTDTNWKMVSNSYSSTTALKTDDSLLTWGYNFYGQLGNGTTTDQIVPQIINTCSLGTEDFGTAPIRLYPNPAENQVNIAYDGTVADPQLEIYDMTGRLVASHQAKGLNGTWALDLNPMATGIYVVVLKQNNRIIMQKKLQKL